MEAEHYLPRFRRTLKIRVIAEGDDAPVVAGLQVYGQDLWQEMSVDVHAGVGNAAPARWNAQVEAVNGVVLGVDEIADGLRLHLLVTDGDQGGGTRPSPIPADRTIVTLRVADGPAVPVEGFSFLPADLTRGPIRIPDLGVVVSQAGEPVERRAGRRADADLRPRGGRAGAVAGAGAGRNPASGRGKAGTEQDGALSAVGA